MEHVLDRSVTSVSRSQLSIPSCLAFQSFRLPSQTKPAIFLSLTTAEGRLQVRDAVPDDADAYVRYWHYSGERIKDLLGIDRNKLGAPEDSRQRFMKMIRTPGIEQQNVVFSITLNDEVIGYTNINLYGPDDNYAHLHTYRCSLRAALKARARRDMNTGSGLARVLIGMLGGYFELFPVRRLILQTRPQNRLINDALDLYMPAAEIKYVDNPAGLAAPGEQCLRYVYREDVAWMLQRAQSIGKPARRRPTPTAAVTLEGLTIWSPAQYQSV